MLYVDASSAQKTAWLGFGMIGPLRNSRGFRAVLLQNLFMLSLCFFGLSCSRSTEVRSGPLVVFAASSVADVITDIAARFGTETKERVVISQGSSGKLCKQIRLGADCDVYVSADTAYLDQLQETTTILDDSRTVLAGNQLVVVMTGKEREIWTGIEKLQTGSLGLIAIASPEHAPAGKRAMEALKRADLWERLYPRVLCADNVRMAARYVANGSIDVGIVYATDAEAFWDKMSVVYRFSSEDHAVISYEGAVCASTMNKSLASAFLKYASSTKVADIWEHHGFIVGDQSRNFNQ